MTTVGDAPTSVARARLGTHLRTTKDCSHSLSSSAAELPEEQIIQTILRLGRTIVLVLKSYQVPRLMGSLKHIDPWPPPTPSSSHDSGIVFDRLLSKMHKSPGPPHKCTGTT